MREIWKDIKGYEGFYQISNKGRVKSFKSSSKYPDKEGHILNPTITKGYLYVGLCNKGKKKPTLVHRLVAEAFVPNPDNYKEVNHMDENKLNNNAKNLEWCNRDYNMSYGTARERQGISLGSPVEQFTVNETPIARYANAEIAGKINRIDSSSIHKCCKGKRVHAGGYSWKYAESY